MKTKLNFSRSKYGKDHISFAQYVINVLFKVCVAFFYGPLGKTKYYALRIEFQERGNSHVHAFVWILDVPRISDETI